MAAEGLHSGLMAAYQNAMASNGKNAGTLANTTATTTTSNVN